MLDHRTHSAAELELLQKREQRERLEREEARATRNRLEKSSTAHGPRLNFVDILNGFSAMTAGGLPGLQAIEEVRKVQALNRRSGTAHTTAHDRLMKAYGGVERFNRLMSGDTPLPDGDRGGRGPRGRVADTNFDIGPGDPGNRPGRYGTWAEGAPTLRAGEYVRDVETKVHGKEAGRHQPSGQLEGIEAGFLLDVTRLLLAALKERAYKPV